MGSDSILKGESHELSFQSCLFCASIHSLGVGVTLDPSCCWRTDVMLPGLGCLGSQWDWSFRLSILVQHWEFYTWWHCLTWSKCFSSRLWGYIWAPCHCRVPPPQVQWDRHLGTLPEGRTLREVQGERGPRAMLFHFPSPWEPKLLTLLWDRPSKALQRFHNRLQMGRSDFPSTAGFKI